MPQIEDLGSFHKDELLRFLLHHMSQELRGQIMAKYPLTYDVLFPGHDRTILTKVSDALQYDQRNLPDS